MSIYSITTFSRELEDVWQEDFQGKINGKFDNRKMIIWEKLTRKLELKFFGSICSGMKQSKSNMFTYCILACFVSIYKFLSNIRDYN